MTRLQKRVIVLCFVLNMVDGFVLLSAGLVGMAGGAATTHSKVSRNG